MKKNEKNKSSYNPNIKKKSNKTNYKTKDNIYDLDIGDVNQLKNVKNIIKDNKNNKNKLKEVIDEHFGRNQTEGNKRNIYFKNT